MRNSIFAVLFALAATFSAKAQVFNPVKWSFSYKLDGDEHAILKFSAKMEQGWHVYSTTIVPDIGPVPTSVDFQKLEGAKLVGSLKEPKPHREMDPNFNMELAWFDNSVTIEQRIKLTSPMARVEGELTYMTCDATKCLPPEYLPFKFDIEAALKSDESSATPTAEISEIAPNPVADATAKPALLEPVKWRFEAIQNIDESYTIRAIAKIQEGWHVYSKDLPDGDGPVPTALNLTEGDFELIGALKETGEVHHEYDPNFMMDLSYYDGELILEQRIKANGLVKGEVYFMCCDDMMCLPPDNPSFEFDPAAKKISWKGGESAVTKASTIDSGEGEPESGSINSLLAIFFLSFLGGFAALLTPCVFPMIPMTVSFFTKHSKTRAKGISNAIIYGLFIIFIYTILGFAVTIIFGADALNALSTNVWFNLIFFALLIVFAISFLGAFEITLPASWVNKADQASDKGGLIGIFFMAFTLALVSFSCTGPIIGTLLVEAAVNGGVSGPLIGMLGFSLALALPFGLFAAFPGWLNTLPKSGGWLNSVKVVLGFLEIGLAFKFLSNADLVVQAGLLNREVFIAIWIAVSAMLTLYLLGFIKMPHDSPLDHIGVGRALLGTLFLSFTVYLIPGLWGAPLKLISGFPPPLFYSESPNGFGGMNAVATVGTNEASKIPAGADPAHCPHNLNCFHDFEEGLAYAKQVNKPVLIDFTGWACVNCRRMEEQVWSDPKVLTILRDDVVLISLYVDEKTPLPENEQYISAETGKKIKTVGNKWADFQITHFASNSQPQYAIMNHSEIKALNGTTAYDPDIDKYMLWLKEGVNVFHH